MSASSRKESAPRTAVGAVGATDASQLALCFDAPPQVTRRLPSPQHLPGRVLARLLRGRRFTHLDSIRELGHARLADSIWKLRKLGWNIETLEQVVPTSDAGRDAVIGIYFLTQEEIVNAGEAGREYAAEVAMLEEERQAA